MSDNHISETPFVSVIIPVFNDPKRLMLCLAALEKQSYPADRYEVIVVDNGSERDIRGVVGGFPHARAALETRPGSYFARNHGLSLARGEVIGFTDADCIPQADWIATGVRYLGSAEQPRLVAGEIAIFYQDPNNPSAVELYEQLTAFPQQKFVEKYHFGATANVFAYRSMIDQVGPFNEALKSGGDREWGQRVRAAGFAQVYAPDLRVFHPARPSFDELRHKVVRVTVGMERVRGARPYPASKFAKAVIKDLVPRRKVAQIWRDQRLDSVGQKGRVTGVLLGLQVAQAWSRLQVRFGGIGDVR